MSQSRGQISERQTIGIIGAGAMALDVHIPVLLARRDARIAWVADVSPAALRRAQQRYGLRGPLLAGKPSELPPSDAVLLALPVGVRTPYHQELSRRECRVYVEKPFARTREEALAILQAYAVGRLACGYQRRLYSSTDSLRQLVAEGKYGRVRRVRVREGALTMATGMSSNFRDNPELSGGGVLIDLGSHGIDLAFHITGTSSAHILSQCLIFDSGVDRDVTLRAVLAGAQEPVELLVELSWLRDRGREFVVEFEHAKARVGVNAVDQVEVSVNGSVATAAPAPERYMGGSVWAPVSRAWSLLLSGRTCDRLGALDPNTCVPAVSLIEQTYTRARLS
jgi:predicted dehydrogenase